MWRLFAGEEDDFIEVELADGFGGDVGMAEVNGIEGSADEANFGFLDWHECLGTGREIF